MNGSKLFQICMKILRIIGIISIVVVSASAIFNALVLFSWIVYDDISFVNKSDFYKQILAFSDLGAYNLNISSYSSEVIYCVVRTTLLIHLLGYINTAINAGTLFVNECYKALRLVGLRFIVFPFIALTFSGVIHYYLKTGSLSRFNESGYLVLGIVCFICSFIFKYLDNTFFLDKSNEVKVLEEESDHVSKIDDIE